MGILGQKAKFKVAPPAIRVETIAVNRPKPPPKAKSLVRSRDPLRSDSRSPRLSPRPRGSPSPLPTASSSSADGPGRSLKRKATKLGSDRIPTRRSPASDRVAFDADDSASEDDDDWEERLLAQKRLRAGEANRADDPNRNLVSPDLVTLPPDGEEQRMIHAVEVASLELKCTPSLGAPPDEVAVELQYPGLRQREKYELVSGKDMIDAVAEIISVIKNVAETYLTDDEARPFLDRNAGLVRQLERASSPLVYDYKAFKAALDKYNSKLLRLLNDGAITRNLSQRRTLPSHLVRDILQQVYNRTVAPKVELLAKYQNGTDNVYGELLHPFISDILVRRTRMTSDQVFVDLGSGVGNVVLQAALDIGCESWGCEMMENACNLADAQQREFTARCRLWGISPGKVILQRGDFRTNKAVQEALKRADVVLVNNQAFTSQLNDDLVRMFLDLRTGCKIVSLKTFVHDQKNAANDVGSSILDVEHLTYPEEYVSWTGAGGTFCISTKKG